MVPFLILFGEFQAGLSTGLLNRATAGHAAAGLPAGPCPRYQGAIQNPPI
jgi:hypothetical protein